ncbi:hypothetical protein G9F32_02990 [Acinetobacter sp. 194]|uniref:hypothetical protein n=1 Tax=Acinetobacter shaoyimingii TaxID=2715164 RepID=UPI001408695A|nr:hypothetical protein [Acinetobacter shaoyimingii]NHB56999.1 hypothetical protein [Acinetobacter shaoyimingii]
MARSRNIKPSFFTNENLVEFSFETRLLFIGLWMLADREGRLENRPKKIKMELFPADNIDVAKSLQELSDANFITLYNGYGTELIRVENFIKHQSPHGSEKDSDLPDVDGTYTIYQRNPKNKTVVGNPIILTREQWLDYKGGATKKSKSNSGLGDLPLDNGEPTVKQPCDNALKEERGILNPDCGMMNEDLLKDESDPRFVFDLSVVNTKLKMAMLNPISNEELLKLQEALKLEYGHRNQMVKNQVLGKLVQWVERQQKTPLAKPKAPVNQDKWNAYFNNSAQQVNEVDVTPKKSLLIEEVGHA